LNHLYRLALVVVAALCLALLPVAAQNADRVVPSEDVQTRVVVRASATSQSQDRGSLKPGESAELLGSVPNWYEIRLRMGSKGSSRSGGPGLFQGLPRRAVRASPST
jgi:hypothetical protein